MRSLWNWIGLLAMALLLIGGCKKEDDDGSSGNGNGNGGGGVALWPAHLLVVNGIDTTEIGPPQWQVSSASTFEPYGVPDYWYALHEVVLTNTSQPNEQWRFGFIGLYLTATGTGPTMQQTSTMVDVGLITGGYWRWDETSMSYQIDEGRRMQYVDAAGVVWSTGSSGSVEVFEAQETGASSGVMRQARFTMQGTLSNAAIGSSIGPRTCIYSGPALVQ